MFLKCSYFNPLGQSQRPRIYEKMKKRMEIGYDKQSKYWKINTMKNWKKIEKMKSKNGDKYKGHASKLGQKSAWACS